MCSGRRRNESWARVQTPKNRDVEVLGVSIFARGTLLESRFCFRITFSLFFFFHALQGDRVGKGRAPYGLTYLIKQLWVCRFHQLYFFWCVQLLPETSDQTYLRK